ncbi:hypothetical protein EGW08_015420 [Elysia chlorotica]|uniref:P/Homo B domain-containing protein n=1 Tax=Elysia chlorotica TaxID=188477 RepID=A0A3S1HCW7_ELYCH|nr:hypothetical protein EGW08_015420 [Elysia chlorotica]
MNVMEAWKKGFTGKNVVVTILDDGLEHQHQDLRRNYDPYASYDINQHDPDPVPRYDPSNENRHGTRCAGEVAAEANNTHCTVGIAPDSRIGGIRMLDGDVFDAVEAASLSFNRSHIDIYSASWGPDDDGKVVDGPGKLAMKAFIEGINEGRNGKGSIFVWASGNGGSARDSCNCDGYTNSIFTVSISSTSETGKKPWYLEECSSTLATTYSSGAIHEKQMATTDLHNRCTTTHTGTSASAPLAAGIIAMVLEANKDLTWRDVQYITLMTARPEPIQDGQWITNALGRKVSLRYGYGLMDASAMVDLALKWRNVPEKHECVSVSPDTDILLQPKQKYSSKLEVFGCQGQPDREINFLEHVQARVSLTFYRRGQVILYLTSPSGTRSKLLQERPSDMSAGGFDNWPFLSVQFWGEQPQGVWTLDIEDAGRDVWGSTGGGKLSSWSLVLHGTAIQPVQLKDSSGGDQPPTDPVPSSIATSTTPKFETVHPLMCHEECKDDQCSGPLPQHCEECKHFRIGSDCVPECPGQHYVADGDHVCHPCDASCASCSGPTLLQCLSCPPGHQEHMNKDKSGEVPHYICSPECLPGYYISSNSCLPCDRMCKDCEGGPSLCTACHDGGGSPTPEGACELGGPPGRGRLVTPSTKSPVMFLVALGILISIMMVVTGAGVVYSYRSRLFCFSNISSRPRYGMVPNDDEEEEANIRLKYNDGLDDDYGA